MTRRLSIAMAVSTVIHLAALSSLAYWFGKASPGPALLVPELQVKIQAVDPGPVPGSKPDDDAVDEPVPAARHQGEPAVQPEQPKSAADPARMSANIIAVAELAVPEPTPRADVTAIVTTESESAHPRPVTQRLSPDEDRMLGNRIREWAEEFDVIDAAADVIRWNHDGKDYEARFTRLPTDAETGIPLVAVEVSTEDNGRTVSSALTLRKLAFSSYAQFVNRWDPDVQIHDDELDGRFHANSEISLNYNSRTHPVFHDKVTTTARRIDVRHTGARKSRDEIFAGGLETGVARISLPNDLRPPSELLLVRESQVHELDTDARLVFAADGSYTVQPLHTGKSRYSGKLSGRTTYFVADDKVAVHVRGTVNGNVLVYSPERIVIDGDLLYADDPGNGVGSDDFLGLVSDKFVDVAPPAVTGHGDLTIHAAIHAKRRFAVRKFDSARAGVLYLYGSLSAGSVSATEPRYATRIRYDQRFQAARPPGFPMTNRYEVESWDAVWTERSSD